MNVTMLLLKSIRKNLLNFLIKLLKTKNVKYIYIENLLMNEHSKYLYEKLGFKIFREDRRKELI